MKFLEESDSLDASNLAVSSSYHNCIIIIEPSEGCKIGAYISAMPIVTQKLFTGTVESFVFRFVPNLSP